MDTHLLRFDKTSKFGFIDFETYNLCLNFIGNKPWQTGLMTVVNGENVWSRDIIINWPKPPKFNPIMVRELFHCSVPELVARIERDGISPEKAFLEIHKFLEESDYIVGHNILGFDTYLVKEFYEMAGKPWKHLAPKFIDTFAIFKGVELNIPFKKTDNLLEYQYRMYHKIKKGLKGRLMLLGKKYEIEHDYEKLHDALVDLDLNRKVFNHLKFLIEI